MAYDYDKDLLYEKYKYYGFTENVITLELIKPVYDRITGTIKNKIQYVNHYKFEGFYIISFETDFFNELRETMIFFEKDRKKLENNLFILYYHLYFGRPNLYEYHNINKIIDEYCSVYDDFQKINFIERIDRMIIRTDMCCKLPTTDFKLTESEYKLLKNFLLKHLNLENIIKIEHYPKKGFLRRI